MQPQLLPNDVREGTASPAGPCGEREREPRRTGRSDREPPRPGPQPVFTPCSTVSPVPSSGTHFRHSATCQHPISTVNTAPNADSAAPSIIATATINAIAPSTDCVLGGWLGGWLGDGPTAGFIDLWLSVVIMTDTACSSSE